MLLTEGLGNAGPEQDSTEQVCVRQAMTGQLQEGLD